MKGFLVTNGRFLGRLAAVLVAAGAVFAALAMTQRAHAAMAVIDVRAIAQLITQVRTMRDQLNTARSHLTQATEEYRSITGVRGMDRLLGSAPRNYLPPDWQEMERVVAGASAAYGSLAASLQSAINANEVLTPADLAEMSVGARERVEEARKSAALLQVLSREALATTSGRFASLQGLIAAIPGATDQKAVLELQARIEAEQGMLQNEETKLAVLYQAAQAEEWARKQRLREQVVADVGSLRGLPGMGL